MAPYRGAVGLLEEQLGLLYCAMATTNKGAAGLLDGPNITLCIAYIYKFKSVQLYNMIASQWETTDCIYPGLMLGGGIEGGSFRGRCQWGATS
jgi:hypothetical protein